MTDRACNRPGNGAPETDASPSPLGEVGPVVEASQAICKCGATERKPNDPERCVKGHVLAGNGIAVVAVGARGLRFWRDHDAERRATISGVLADRGHNAESATVTLKIAADGIAQAKLVRDAAFDRMVEQGGPFTASGRSRRCFTAWLQAGDRLERYLRLVGLDRVPRQVTSPIDYIEGRDRA